MALPTATVIVPMRNEEAFIVSCLDSLCAQDYPRELLDILVMDGESTDRSAELVTAYAARDPRVRLLANPARTQAAGMNLGIAAATGEIIVRADAHAVYGPEYVSKCVEHLATGRAENVGGLQRCAGTAPFARAVGAAQNSRFGAGNAAYRLATTACYTDTVWLGAWYRKTLVELGGYDEEAPPNEDYELNCRLRKRGGRILLDPTLPSAYYPRTSLPHLWRQYLRYGRAKVRTVQRHPESLLLRQLAAPALVAVLLASVLLLPLSHWPLLLAGGAYLLTVLAAGTHTAARDGWRLWPLLPVVYLTMHLAWGCGFWWGIMRYGGFPLRPRKILEAERALGQAQDSQPGER